jgi:hypothetical protein
VDDRVLFFTPGMWEILRYLGTYERMPLQLLIGAAKARSADLIYLSHDQDMVEALDMQTGRPVRQAGGHGPGGITAERIAENVLWAEINGFGRAAEKRLGLLRPVLAFLDSFTSTTLGKLLTAIEASDDNLIALDQHGYIELRRPDWAARERATGRPYVHAPRGAFWIGLDRSGDWRRDVDARITAKGRKYTAVWEA